MEDACYESCHGQKGGTKTLNTAERMKIPTSTQTIRRRTASKSNADPPNSMRSLVPNIATRRTT